MVKDIKQILLNQGTDRKLSPKLILLFQKEKGECDNETNVDKTKEKHQCRASTANNWLQTSTERLLSFIEPSNG